MSLEVYQRHTSTTPVYSCAGLAISGASKERVRLESRYLCRRQCRDRLALRNEWTGRSNLHKEERERRSEEACHGHIDEAGA